MFLLDPLIQVYFSVFNLMQMKGEKNLVSKLVETEIAMFRAIRDGSALMQHMEDFYYISLLEVMF